MPIRLCRALGILLVLLGVALAAAVFDQVRMARGDLGFGHFRLIGAAALGLSGGLLLAVGVRLLISPALYHEYAFLESGRFWRWLLAGFLTVFLVLASHYHGIDQARYLCRAFCPLWLALLVSPLLWPARWRDRVAAGLKARWFRWTDIAVGNLVVVVILLEVGLRGLSAWSGTDDLLLSNATGCRMRPGEYPNGIRANSLGFSGSEFVKEKRPGVSRIAILGDSFSVGVRVRYEDNYVTRIEKALPGVEVYNFGVAGTGPREYRLLLSTLVWEYQPDLVLVPIFIGNDITETLFVPELRKLHPDALHVHAVGRKLYRLAREQWRAGRVNAPVEASEFQMGLPPSFSAETYLEVSSGRLVVCRRQESPVYQQRWRDVLRELELLIADCRAHGVPVGVLLLPDEFQVNAELRQRGLQKRGWAEHDIDLLLPQRRLAEFCRTQSISCLDLLPVFTGPGGAAYYPNDSHWNTLGNQLAAEAVAPWLLQAFPDVANPGER